LLKFVTFIPTNVTILWVVFVIKNFANVAFLIKVYGKEKANGSKVTTNLYLFRVYYDFIIIGGTSILFSLFRAEVLTKTQLDKIPFVHDFQKLANDANKHGHGHDLKSILMGNNFIVYIVVIPITFLEICVFYFCKVEAENR